jgi:CRISPR-associated protein Cas1
MIKKTLYFGNPLKLKLQNSQLHIEYFDSNQPPRTIPVEDIGVVIIDHQQIVITHGIMNALIDHNAAILWCDNRHIPNGLVLPMAGNDLFTKKMRIQLNASEPLKKQLWKQTIQQKILNQASILKWMNKEYEPVKKLAANVSSGDTENIEGRASYLYWQTLFENDENFKRHRFGPPPNQLFNYGYAILRAVVARSLIASGCLLAMGIHHRNQYNAFCLADDIMEPYRPYVDKVVLQMLNEAKEPITEDITKEQKQILLQIPALDIHLDEEKSPLMVGMQRTTASLMKCFEGEARKILYPEMI